VREHSGILFGRGIEVAKDGAQKDQSHGSKNFGSESCVFLMKLPGESPRPLSKCN